MRKPSQAKADFWMERIMECRKSGLPDARWCKEQGIPPSSLYYWIKKLRMEASEMPAPHHLIPCKQDVVPLHVVDTLEDSQVKLATSSTAIIIKLEDISLEIQNGADEITISHTINALRRLC